MVCDLVGREEVGVLACCIDGDVLLLEHWNGVEDGIALGAGLELEWKLYSLLSIYTYQSLWLFIVGMVIVSYSFRLCETVRLQVSASTITSTSSLWV